MTVTTSPPPARRGSESIYPVATPTLTNDVDGALGDGSQFHRSFGYYAHGGGPETAVAPAGWEERLVRVEISPVDDSRRQRIEAILANLGYRG